MMRILKAYDVPQKLLNAIDLLYQNTKARVITPERETEYFKINAGVLQGGTLAPYLFAIVLDYVMRKTFNNMEEELGFTVHRRRSRRSPAVMLTDPDFADDLAIFTEEFEQPQEVLKRFKNNAEEVGLVCNSKKTVIQTFNQENVLDVVAKNGDSLKNVKNFKYLGASTESTEKDFDVRKTLAWSALHKLKKIWSSSLSVNIKVRLFTATVESILLYGSDTWTLTKKMTKLDGCYTQGC